MAQPAHTRLPGSITVAAVQSRIRLFHDAGHFQRQIAQDVQSAMAHEPDLVVFPEDIGTGLVALGTPSAARASSLQTAMLAVGLRNICRVLPYRLRRISTPRALLMAVAGRMREVYVGTFSELAARHSVFIAAGSVLLPHENDNSGRVYNTFHLFGPDGAIIDTTDKLNLVDMESAGGLDLTPGAPADLSVWQTPIGTFAPIICFDAWDTDLVGRLVAEGAQMLLVPSANPLTWSEDEAAARREGMYARVREFGVPGVEPFAVGELAGLAFEGQSYIVAPDADEPDGVRILAQAQSATEPEVISATVGLPSRAGAAHSS